MTRRGSKTWARVKVAFICFMAGGIAGAILKQESLTGRWDAPWPIWGLGGIMIVGMLAYIFGGEPE